MIEPYCTEPGITLYHADCREVVALYPVGYFDLCIADPPYGIGESSRALSQGGDVYVKRTGFQVGRMGFPKTTYNVDDYDAVKWERSHFDQLRLAAKDLVIFGGNYYADLLGASSSWLVWDKDNTGNFADVELAWTSHKSAARLFKWRWNGLLQQDMKNKEPRIYPGQKPVPLMRWVLNLFTTEQSLILDPCCGSGPVVRACKDLARAVVACDISERALELTARRLQQEVLSFEAQSFPESPR